MCSQILSVLTLEAAQQPHWRLAKYSISFRDLFFSYILQDSCQKTSGCTALNWKYEGDHVCILRACSLPVDPPKHPLPKWKAFYVTFPKTTATTTISTTTTSSISRSVTHRHGPHYFIFNANESRVLCTIPICLVLSILVGDYIATHLTPDVIPIFPGFFHCYLNWIQPPSLMRKLNTSRRGSTNS